ELKDEVMVVRRCLDADPLVVSRGRGVDQEQSLLNEKCLYRADTTGLAHGPPEQVACSPNRAVALFEFRMVYHALLEQKTFLVIELVPLPEARENLVEQLLTREPSLVELVLFLQDVDPGRPDRGLEEDISQRCREGVSIEGAGLFVEVTLCCEGVTDQ